MIDGLLHIHSQESKHPTYNNKPNDELGPDILLDTSFCIKVTAKLNLLNLEEFFLKTLHILDTKIKKSEEALILLFNTF